MRAVHATIQTANVDANSALAANLRNAARVLAGRDGMMAGEFFDKLAKYGSLSAAQLKWANDLCAKAQPRDTSVPVRVAPGREKVDIGNFSAMVALFDQAAKGRKTAPKVLLKCDDVTIQLSVAGASSREPGTINVSTQGGFGNSTWFGRILKDGQFEKSPRDASPDALMTTLRDFSKNPLDAMVKYGRLMGACSICNRTLVDPVSVERGIGPICAAKFGF